MLKEVSKQFDNPEEIVVLFVEIIDNNDSDDRSTGIEYQVQYLVYWTMLYNIYV